MMKNIIAIVLCLLALSGFSQSPFNNTFGTSIDDDIASGVSLIDSNLYLLTISDYSTNTGPIALYVDMFGNIVKSYQDINIEGWNSKYHKYFNSSYVTTGGYYVYSESAQDILLQIINDTSTIILKHFGGGLSDYGRDLEILPDSGFLIVGTTNSYGAGGYDVYIVRTDKNGDSLWTRTYGNSDKQMAYGIERESDSVYVVAGLWANLDNNSMDAFAMKINLQGDTLAFKLYGNHLQNFGQALCKTSDGYAIAGWSTVDYGGFYSRDAVLYKLDSNLNLLWTKYYGTLGTEDIFDVIQTYDNGFVLVGHSAVSGKGEDVYIVRTNSIGDTLWTKTLGGDYNDRAYSVVQTPDSGFAIVGNTYSYGAGGSDAFFLKLKPNGDITTAIGLAVKPKVQSFSIFPNPASSRTSIEFGKTVSGLIIIYSIDGKVLNKINIFSTQNVDIDLSTLNKGVYILKFVDENDNRVTYGKLIVQ